VQLPTTDSIIAQPPHARLAPTIRFNPLLVADWDNPCLFAPRDRRQRGSQHEE
jgi:hypothetical protein